MVFFTCNACGASLKKNQVEKHYQNECPTCEVLSCMDCGQDFYGDAYANHTKCISEAEKYQGALFKEKGKGGPGKGERKQQEWLEQVKQSVSGAKLNPKVSSLLERIADYPNIPRKKAKFENFVRNSFNVRDQKVLTQLWDAFSGATKKTQATDVTSGKTVAMEKHASDVQTDRAVCDDPVPESRKKKKKHKETTEFSDASGTCTGDAVTTNGDSAKKHREIAGCTDTSDPGDAMIKYGGSGVGMEDGDEVPKRKKKKVYKAELLTAKEETVKPENASRKLEVDDGLGTKKVKKKKKKQTVTEAVDHADVAMTNGEAEGDNGEERSIAKKAKKRKHKLKECGISDDSGDMLGKKRKHDADLDDEGYGDVILPAKKLKRVEVMEIDKADSELSNGVSQVLVEKRKKKKHKHKIE